MSNTKNVKDRIINELIDKWGMTKFVKVISITTIGAMASALLADSVIPNEPRLVEENEKESN